MDVNIIKIQGADIEEVRLDAAFELSHMLFVKEKLGLKCLADMQTEMEREALMTGYVAAIYDYLTARQTGRLGEPQFETVENGD